MTSRCLCGQPAELTARSKYLCAVCFRDYEEKLRKPLPPPGTVEREASDQGEEEKNQTVQGEP